MKERSVNYINTRFLKELDNNGKKIENVSYYRSLWHFYKVFNEDASYLFEKMDNIRFLDDLRGELGPNVVIPDVLYHDNNGIDVAYRTRFLKGMPLSRFSGYVDDIIYLFLEASKYCERFHEYGITLGDVNFNNFLVNQYGLFMIDFDSIIKDESLTGQNYAMGISHILKKFYDLMIQNIKGYVNLERFDMVSEETDHLSFLLGFLLYFFEEDVFLFEEAKDYAYWVENLPFMEEIVKIVKNIYERGYFYKVPSFSEIVNKKTLTR